MEHLVCQLSSAATGITASISRVVNGRLDVNHGFGECVADAVSGALRLKSIVFESQEDELLSCIAALRNRPVKICVSGRSVRSQEII